jgi:hypothetical protein
MIREKRDMLNKNKYLVPMKLQNRAILRILPGNVLINLKTFSLIKTLQIYEKKQKRSSFFLGTYEIAVKNVVIYCIFSRRDYYFICK